MSKYKQFWPSEKEIERLCLDHRPLNFDSSNFVHCIEHRALVEVTNTLGELLQEVWDIDPKLYFKYEEKLIQFRQEIES